MAAALGDRLAVHWEKWPSTSRSSWWKRARKAAQAASEDGVVSVGGGSATSLAKALALDTGVPIVAVPTT